MNIKRMAISLNMLKCIVLFVINIEYLKKKKSNIFKRTLSLSVIYSKCGPEYEKIFKEEESSKIF